MQLSINGVAPFPSGGGGFGCGAGYERGGTGSRGGGTGSDVELAADVVTPVPTMVASFSDDMAWAKDMLTLVFGTVVPLTQLQSDLYSFLMGIAGAAPVMEVGGFVGAGLSPAGDASVV